MNKIYGTFSRCNYKHETSGLLMENRDEGLCHLHSPQFKCFYDMEGCDTYQSSNDNHIVFILGYISNIDEVIGAEYASNFADYVINQIESKKIDTMVNKLSGLFALLIIYKEHIIFISDRYRSRAIYYSIHNDIVYFSNNIRDYFIISKTRPEFDWNHSLKVNNYTGKSNLCWKGISELKPYEIVYINNEGVICRKWIESSLKPPSIVCLDDIIRQTINRFDFKDSVLSLSGGVDSGLLAAYTKNKLHNAITINWDTMIQDGEYDRAKCLSDLNSMKLIDVFIESITANDYIDYLTFYASHTMTTEYLMKIHLFSKAKLNGFKKVLTGQGIDELFGGYSYQFSSYEEYLKSKHEEAIINFLICDGISDSKSYVINFDNIDILYPNSGLNNMREYDVISQTSAMGWTSLYTEERCAAFNGVLNYSPFLESDIFNFSLNIADEDSLYNKNLIRKLYVEKNKIESPRKIPFVYGQHYISVKNYLYDLLFIKAEGKESLLDVILSTKAFDSNGLLNKDHYIELINATKSEESIPEAIELIFKIANCALLSEYMDCSLAHESK